MIKGVEVILLGALFVGFIYWQIQLLEEGNDDRIIIPSIFSVVVFVGVFVLGVLSLNDSRKPEFSMAIFFLNLIKAFVFGVVFLLKVWFGPIAIGIVVCSTVYFFFEYGEFRAIPLLNTILGWIFSNFNEWIKATYMIGTGLYILGSTIYDSTGLIKDT